MRCSVCHVQAGSVLSVESTSGSELLKWRQWVSVPHVYISRPIRCSTRHSLILAKQNMARIISLGECKIERYLLGPNVVIKVDILALGLGRMGRSFSCSRQCLPETCCMCDNHSP